MSGSIKKISEWTFYQKLYRFIFAIILVFVALLYLGSLIVPNWEFFLANPFWHQTFAYLTILGISVLIFLIVALFVSLAVEKQELEKVSQEQLKKIQELENELEKLKKR